MSLQKWVEFGWLRAHKTSKKEIADLLRIRGAWTGKNCGTGCLE